MKTNHWEDPEWVQYWVGGEDDPYDPFYPGDCADADEVEGWDE